MGQFSKVHTLPHNALDCLADTIVIVEMFQILPFSADAILL